MKFKIEKNGKEILPEEMIAEAEEMVKEISPIFKEKIRLEIFTFLVSFMIAFTLFYGAMQIEDMTIMKYVGWFCFGFQLSVTVFAFTEMLKTLVQYFFMNRRLKFVIKIVKNLNDKKNRNNE